MNKFLAIAAATALTAFAGGASAVPIILNGGFERPSVPADMNGGTFEYLNGTYNSWTYLTNPGADAYSGLVAASVPGGFCDSGCPTGYGGKQFALIQGLGSISEDTRRFPGGNVVLRWDDANRIGYGNDHTYEVLVDGQVMGTYTPSYTFGGPNTFHAESLTLDLSPMRHNITFEGIVPDDGTAFIDNVSVSVPEPASWALMMTGCGLIGATLRRRRSLLAAEA